MTDGSVIQETKSMRDFVSEVYTKYVVTDPTQALPLRAVLFITPTGYKMLKTLVRLLLLHYPQLGIQWIMQGHHTQTYTQKFSCVEPTSHNSFGIMFKLLKGLAIA